MKVYLTSVTKFETEHGQYDLLKVLDGNACAEFISDVRNGTFSDTCLDNSSRLHPYNSHIQQHSLIKWFPCGRSCARLSNIPDRTCGCCKLRETARCRVKEFKHNGSPNIAVLHYARKLRNAVKVVRHCA